MFQRNSFPSLETEKLEIQTFGAFTSFICSMEIVLESIEICACEEGTVSLN